MRPSAHFALSLIGSRQAQVAEIGVEEGRNAETLLEEWCDPWSIFLTLVEIDPTREPEIRERLGQRSNFKLIIGDSSAVAQTFTDGWFDYVYIDDDHTSAGIRRSVDAWFPKVRTGGVLGGHDYMDRPGDEVREFVTSFAREHEWQVSHLELDWWVVKV
jgi:hypothetical protein